MKKLRRELGWSQHYIAREIGMSQNNYSRLENGKAEITLKQLNRLSKVFATDMRTLIEEEPT